MPWRWNGVNWRCVEQGAPEVERGELEVEQGARELANGELEVEHCALEAEQDAPKVE